MNDLSLVLEEEIWQELCKRYDGVIVVTIRNLDKKSESISVSYHGGKALCVGLAEHVKDKILESLRETTREKEEA